MSARAYGYRDAPSDAKGAQVPWTWPDEGGQAVDVPDLARRILEGPKVEGVTFLGGEPFAQAAALAELGYILKQTGLSVLTFTGYVLESIQAAGRRDWMDLLAITDLLIDGPFCEDQTDLSRPWVGSSNQRYHFLTDRYRQLEAHLTKIPNRIEVRILPSGEVRINGMIRSRDLRSLTESLQMAKKQATGLLG